LLARNFTRRTLLADALDVADTPEARSTGLLDRASLEPGEGLLLWPCQAIHTVGLRFAIDAAFVDTQGIVLQIYHNLPPGKLTAPVRNVACCLEVPAGILAATGTQIGDQLWFFW